MKIVIIIFIAFMPILLVDPLIFMKRLSDKRYPGVCYPIHSRIYKTKKWKTIYLWPGQEHQDENICGMSVCMNPEGDVMVYYCPTPIPAAQCRSERVNTRVIFPECCWQCVADITCVDKMRFPQYPYPPKEPVPALPQFP